MIKALRYYKDYSLSYSEYGNPDGFPILIQHGLIASIRDYHLFDRLIELGTHPICIARPGYGQSSPYNMRNISEWGELVSFLADELDLSHFDILGMSSGSSYSYSIAYNLPSKTRNIFVFSGTPALYDENIVAFWPFPVDKQASISKLSELAKELFFSHLPNEKLLGNDIKDSMMNNCFGIAHDFKLRIMDWGFSLSNIKAHVYMQHSRIDSQVPFITAEMTSRLLPNCTFDIRENGDHFTNELLDDFIKTTMTKHYEI